ncbi:hypothetical protein GZH46_02681, partial [Fragariocoptes setiger]
SSSNSSSGSDNNSRSGRHLSLGNNSQVSAPTAPVVADLSLVLNLNDTRSLLFGDLTLTGEQQLALASSQPLATGATGASASASASANANTHMLDTIKPQQVNNNKHVPLDQPPQQQLEQYVNDHAHKSVSPRIRANSISISFSEDNNCRSFEATPTTTMVSKTKSAANIEGVQNNDECSQLYHRLDLYNSNNLHRHRHKHKTATNGSLAPFTTATAMTMTTMTFAEVKRINSSNNESLRRCAAHCWQYVASNCCCCYDDIARGQLNSEASKISTAIRLIRSQNNHEREARYRNTCKTTTTTTTPTSTSTSTSTPTTTTTTTTTPNITAPNDDHQPQIATTMITEAIKQSHNVDLKQKNKAKKFVARQNLVTVGVTARHVAAVMLAYVAITSLLSVVPHDLFMSQSTPISTAAQLQATSDQNHQLIMRASASSVISPELESESKSKLEPSPSSSSSSSSSSSLRLPTDVDGEDNLQQVHSVMSERELRRTFHVDSHDQVPPYEIVALAIAPDGSHHTISPISNVDALLSSSIPSLSSEFESEPESALSSANTWSTTANQHQQSRRTKRSPTPTATTSQVNDHTDDNEMVIKMNAFGRKMKLRLKRNADFQRRIKDMKMFMAETKDGKLSLSEVKSVPRASGPTNTACQSQSQSANNNNEKNCTSQSARSDHDDQSTTDDTNSNINEDDDDVGAIYHDESNVAALLVNRAHDGRLSIDGTIGNEYVIKPLAPDTLVGSSGAPVSRKASMSSSAADNRQEALQRALHMHDNDPHDDDEMFLDEDEAIESATNHSNNNNNNNSGNTTPTITNLTATASADADKDKEKDVKQQAAVAAAAAALAESIKQRQQRAHLERKWRKYRKLQANAHVPKIGELMATAPSIQHHVIYKRRADETQHVDEHVHSVFDQLSSGASNMDRGFGVGGQFWLEPTASELMGVNWTLGNQQNMMNDRRMMSQRRYDQSGVNNMTSMRDAHASSAQSHQPHQRPHRRVKRQAPDTVWPEVLLVVDYDSYLLHGADSRDVKRYFVSFWNGVDLRYKLLVHPRIRIGLAGMIVAKDRDATPYLERNRLRAPNADAVDAAGALTDMGKYLYREDRLPTYDLAVVITKLDMCRRRYEGGRCNRGTAGFAYVGGACVVNKRLEKVNSVAIIEDSGGFSGIIVAAHEVGHLLGCVHDGSPPPSYLGGPGATHCPWEDGFIMSDLRHTERGFRWSQCSVEQFKHFLNGETATCLYNYPHESQMLHRMLPGTMLTLDEQCKRDRGTNACFKDARVCAQLFCFDSSSGYCVSYRPAAEGSPCGDGQLFV